jgi:hypothetical protein
MPILDSLRLTRLTFSTEPPDPTAVIWMLGSFLGTYTAMPFAKVLKVPPVGPPPIFSFTTSASAGAAARDKHKAASTINIARGVFFIFSPFINRRFDGE